MHAQQPRDAIVDRSRRAAYLIETIKNHQREVREHMGWRPDVSDCRIIGLFVPASWYFEAREVMALPPDRLPVTVGMSDPNGWMVLLEQPPTGQMIATVILLPENP